MKGEQIIYLCIIGIFIVDSLNQITDGTWDQFNNLLNTEKEKKASDIWAKIEILMHKYLHCIFYYLLNWEKGQS